MAGEDAVAKAGDARSVAAVEELLWQLCLTQNLECRRPRAGCMLSAATNFDREVQGPPAPLSGEVELGGLQ